MDDLYARLAASFGDVAAEYALHRPDYPDEAVAWALASTSYRGPNIGTVLDLGAGTGKLTAAIVRCGVPTAAVLAVEPDDRMRAEFSRQLPEIVALRGSAERIPAKDEAFDAVLVGQAFRWFDPDRALPEIARVLRPGGVLAAMSNIEDDSVGWVAELVTAVQVAELTAAAQTDQTERPVGIGPRFAEMPEHPAFGTSARRQFPWRWPRTIDSLLGTMSTHSAMQVSRPDQRAAALATIRQFLEQHPATREGTFELPMQTMVQRVTRCA